MLGGYSQEKKQGGGVGDGDTGGKEAGHEASRTALEGAGAAVSYCGVFGVI